LIINCKLAQTKQIAHNGSTGGYWTGEPV
jgi:hypothetical protein